MRRAIEEPDAKYMLPSPAVPGLRALGTDMLPAMPDHKKCSLPLVGSGQGEAWIRQHDKAVRSHSICFGVPHKTRHRKLHLK